MSRFNLILLALAALQGVAFLGMVLFGGPSKGDAKENAERSLLAISASEVSKIEISNPDEKDHPSIVLERGDKGWTVASADGYPVRDDAGASFGIDPKDEKKPATSTADTFLKKIVDLKIRRPIIRAKENHGPVKVADEKYERRLTLKGKDGKELAALFLANGTRARTVYVRRAGENEVYETDGVSVWDVSTVLGTWADLKYVELKQDEVVACTLKLADGDKTITIEKRAIPDPAASQPTTSAPSSQPTTQPVKTIDAWFLAGPEAMRADTTEVENLLRKATSLRAGDVVGKKAPEGANFEKPTAVLTVKMKDGKEHLVTIGGQKAGDSKDHFAKASGSDYYVTLPDWDVKSLLELTAEKLKEKPPASQPSEHSENDGHDH